MLRHMHDAVLNHMEKHLPHVLASQAASDAIVELGSLLRETALPQEELGVIIARLRSMAGRLSTKRDEAPTRKYLEALMEELETRARYWKS